MRRREREGKAANGLRGEPARGLARDMGGMVVENDLDRGVGGVGGVEELEKLDEFAATVAFLDQGVDVTGEQIDRVSERDSAAKPYRLCQRAYLGDLLVILRQNSGLRVAQTVLAAIRRYRAVVVRLR